MLNGDINKAAKNKYGSFAVSAALQKYTALLAKQTTDGLTGEEAEQKRFYELEFGFSPPKDDPPPSSPHSHYFGGY